ncbi:MAG TPA: hypothetical protein VJT16_01435 [Streptosporangiaceae bacterium]|nr:hypothetical protein [Streptosporangiaceae bacterium]
MNTPQPVTRSYPVSRSLSRRLVVAAELLFTSGVSIGWLHYLHRSATPLTHVPGSNAWWQEAVVAVAAAVVLGVIWLSGRTGRISGRLLLAPLGRSAARRIWLLYRQALRGPLSFGRALLATPLLLTFMFGLFRAGYQITSGLDPNSTVDAWGGPTYIGAMACHYLDIFVIMAGCAWLLDRLMPRSPQTPARPAALRESRAAASHGQPT